MRAKPQQPTYSNERIRGLETSVESMKESMEDMKMSISSIQNILSKTRETNWSTVFAGLALVGSLYAAAIRPLNLDIERQSVAASSLATAVLVQNDKMAELTLKLHVLESAVNANTKNLEIIKAEGSPMVDKRLTLLEFQFNKMKP